MWAKENRQMQMRGLVAGDDLHPTHRKVRDGWAPDEFAGVFGGVLAKEIRELAFSWPPLKSGREPQIPFGNDN